MGIGRSLVITVLIIAAAAVAGLAYTGTLTKVFPLPANGITGMSTQDSGQDVSGPAKSMKFGADSESLSYTRKTQWTPEYATLWVGDWVATDPYGWDTVDRFITSATAKGVTPVVIWSYWGGDLSQTAVITGANGKSVSGWTQISQQLATRMAQGAPGKQTIVVLEPEFNRGDIEKYAPFDTLLADQIAIFKNQGVVTVVGFGNWNKENFLTFEKSIQMADMIGFDAVRIYPTHSKDQYGSVVQDAVDTARFLAVNFDQKPLLLYDFAISTTDPDLLQEQQKVVKAMCDNSADLEQSGVVGIIYRYLVDPTKYVPPEEKHWGLIESNGRAKPALADWLGCVQTVKGTSAAAPIALETIG